MLANFRRLCVSKFRLPNDLKCNLSRLTAMLTNTVNGRAFTNGTHPRKTKKLKQRRARAANLAADANVNDLADERARLRDTGRCHPTFNFDVGHSGVIADYT